MVRYVRDFVLVLCVTVMAVSAAERPNILWITSEDNSISWVSCYGGVNCSTPNIDRLAEEGFRYTHCFDNAAVQPFQGTDAFRPGSANEKTTTDGKCGPAGRQSGCPGGSLRGWRPRLTQFNVCSDHFGQSSADQVFLE